MTLDSPDQGEKLTFKKPDIKTVQRLADKLGPAIDRTVKEKEKIEGTKPSEEQPNSALGD